MELKKVNGGVWVKASEELSLHYEDVFIQWDGSKIVAYYDNSIKQYRSGTRVYNISEVEWLKPIEQVYVLTEDEMRIFYDKATTEGMREVNTWKGAKTFEQFFESITK